MTSFLWFLGLLVLAGLFVFLFQIFRAFQDIFLLIQRLAQEDYRTIILLPPFGLFKNTFRNLRKITEQLQTLSTQISDETFNLQAILSSMIEGILLVDSSQRIFLCNKALLHLFGFTYNPVGKTVAEAFQNADLHKAIRDTLSTSTPCTILLQLTNPSTSTTYLEVRCSPLHVAGTFSPIRGVIVVFHDITQIKRTEELRKDFVANVSHEFRTPLSIIQGYVETLQEIGPSNRELFAKSLDAMAKNCRRLRLLIDDLLTISQLEQRSVPLELEIVNLGDVLHQVLDQMQSAIAEQDAQVEVQIHPDANEIEADRFRIEQIFFNLLTNALRYAKLPDRRLQIRFCINRTESGIEICCKDNGPGIPPEDQPRIFERFYRIQKSRARSDGGTGLGLAIIKNIALAHSGSVSLHSTLGQGTEFCVSLPKVQSSRRFSLPQAQQSPNIPS